MFKIGEFSKLSQVSVRMLRYYDEMNLLKPSEVDKSTGYRLYSANQLSILNQIVFLRDSGFNVSEISKYINSEESEYVLDQLTNKFNEIKKQIAVQQLQLNKIELAKREIKLGQNTMYYEVVIKVIPSYEVLALRKNIANYYCEGELWEELFSFAKKQQIVFTGNSFSIYHDEEYKETDVDVELCVPIQPNSISKIMKPFRIIHTTPVPLMACTMVYGEFSSIAKVFMNLINWLQDHSQYKIKGRTRQIVHRGPWNEKNKSNYLTEIQIPLEEI
ncbi:MerR family transcriptional regulator [Enterococcus sp. LJL99]